MYYTIRCGNENITIKANSKSQILNSRDKHNKRISWNDLKNYTTESETLPVNASLLIDLTCN